MRANLNMNGVGVLTCSNASAAGKWSGSLRARWDRGAQAAMSGEKQNCICPDWPFELSKDRPCPVHSSSSQEPEELAKVFHDAKRRMRTDGADYIGVDAELVDRTLALLRKQHEEKRELQALFDKWHTKVRDARRRLFYANRRKGDDNRSAGS
jgi:hypothetical protein